MQESSLNMHTTVYNYANRCFSSFPESVNSECDIVYSFRLNRAKPKSASDKDGTCTDYTNPMI